MTHSKHHGEERKNESELHGYVNGWVLRSVSIVVLFELAELL
jgi:hypothetical protein